ncbi:MAG: hypothetical protein ACLFNQ_07595 [Spirochaetaceae bacterium]
MNELPEYIHHFSWTTRVSLELPIGFEEESVDPNTGSVIYANDLDDDDEPGARVLVKATAIPPDVENAHLQMLEQSANLVGGTRVSPEHLEIDGFPAAIQQVKYHQEEIVADVVRTECCAQAETLLFSVVCIAFAEDADRYRAAFDHALRTMRFVLDGEPGIDLLVSIRVPDSWEVSSIDGVADEGRDPAVIGIRYFAPPVENLDGYRPTLSVTCGEPDGFGEEWFAEFTAQRLANVEEQYQGFRLLRRDRYMLSSMCDVDALWFEWEAEPGMRFTQVQALLQVDRYRMYVLNAASRSECAPGVVERFENALQTLRVLPPDVEA